MPRNNEASARKRTKCVHLTSVHQPTDVRILHKECRTLVEAGYDVTLIAPSEGNADLYGVKSRAIAKNGGRLRRASLTVWRAYRAAVLENAQVYHFHDPELIGVGLLLKLRGKRVVYDVHEDLPRQILSKEWLPHMGRRFFAFLAELVEAFGAKLFDGIVAATPAIARRFPAKKTVTVQNFPNRHEFSGSDQRPDSDCSCMIAYVGAIARIRGIREMVRAMSFLPVSLGARLMLAGTFHPPELEAEVRRIPGCESVERLGWQSRKDVVKLLTQSCIGLLVFQPEKNHLESQPTKLFEYMAAGLPVVASDFPRWREIVQGAKCGLLVDPLDPHAIAYAVRWLLEHPQEAIAMGQRGKEAVYTRYNWDLEARKLVHLYAGLDK